ncbi:MAG: TylF/MycF/NovP-related O-methyltransferase [Acidimicrobiales bacterium]
MFARLRNRLTRHKKPGARSIRWFHRVNDLLAIPQLTYALLHDRATGGHYPLSWRKRFRLVVRMYRNTGRIETGTSFRAHVAMASKILATPPRVEGCLVECGAWKGGTSTNLSLIAHIVDRKLVVYDSFEGLPEPAEGDRWAGALGTGAFHGALEEVRDNIETHGEIDVCEFRKGWFSDTLPHHREPVVFAYLDVDYQDSLHDCVLHLWPCLTSRGWVFIDEYLRLDFCALFFSEQWWARNFDRPPPGLLGAGTGVGVGQLFAGPMRGNAPQQRPLSAAATRKDFYALWDFVPEGQPDWPVSYDPTDWTTTTRTIAEIERGHLDRIFGPDAQPG